MTAIPSAIEYARLRRQQETEAREAAERDRREHEDEARQEREAEKRCTTQILLLRYDMEFLPRLRKWMNLDFGIDPLRNPGHAFALMVELAKRHIEYAQSETDDTFTVRVTASIPAGWKVGHGIGDTLAEALIMAVWEILDNG